MPTQVAEMHAELMEFNQYLQKRLQDLESTSTIELLELPESNVKAHIPTAFLVGKKRHSYHVYQVKVKTCYLFSLTPTKEVHC